MDVLVTGSSGLVGTGLQRRLTADGHRVVRLRRGGPRGPDDRQWEPMAGRLDPSDLERLDAVVHLAGESIGERRWSEEQKQRILESRTRGTALLAGTLASLDSPPRVLVSASAIGYYGDRGDEVLDESSAPGDTFLADVCVQWEQATRPAADAGIRTVVTRNGIVLSPEGGALARMLLPFRLGLGGRLGSGEQYMSWISLDDAVGAIVHALTTSEVAGALDATGPEPVTNSEFTATLGRVLGRPTILPTPLPALRLRYGRELVQQLLLDSQRVLPRMLESTGYGFRHRTLEAALRAVLDRPV